MLKYSLLITALTATGAFAFNYDSYAPVEMKFFQNISENYEKQDGPGVGSFSNKFRLILPISAKPTPVDKKGAWAIKHYNHFVWQDPQHSSAYTHELMIRADDVNFRLIFQKQLLPYLEKEQLIGKNVLLFCMHGLYNTFDNTHTLFVAEFQALPE